MKTLKITSVVIVILILLIGIKNFKTQPGLNVNTNATSTESSITDEKENSTDKGGYIRDGIWYPNNSTSKSTITTTDKITDNNSPYLCQVNFPIYNYYHNDNTTVYFYEDSQTTNLFTKDSDGTKTYQISDKKTLNQTKNYTVDPDGSCYGYTSESTDPKNEGTYNPFACDQDDMLYGFCPTTNFSKSTLVWKNNNKNDLNNQVGRAYGKYLIPGNSKTLLSEATHWLIPKIPEAKIPTSFTLPVPDHPGETFVYKLEPGDSIDTVANKFALKASDIYNSTPNLPAEFGLKTCLRVADKNSPYRIYCIDTQICQNVGENTVQPVVNNPFDIKIFDIPRNCKLEE